MYAERVKGGKMRPVAVGGGGDGAEGDAPVVIVAAWEGTRQHRALGQSQVCNFPPGCNFPISEQIKHVFLNDIGCFAFHHHPVFNEIDMLVGWSSLV